MDEILSHSMDFGCPFMQSLPARGAWIEIPTYTLYMRPLPSLPARGAWIEIFGVSIMVVPFGCRSPQGERGLKSCVRVGSLDRFGRSPQGERGLKFQREAHAAVAHASLPARGAWIEMA